MVIACCTAYSQDYFLKAYEPYNPNIPSPEEFLEYPIGEQHTRHDLILAYFKKLAEVSGHNHIVHLVSFQNVIAGKAKVNYHDPHRKVSTQGQAGNATIRPMTCSLV